jgi:osmotically-inducible protein OsmY
MLRLASGGLVLLIATAVMAAAPEPGETTLPPTALDRESNNPAKAAIKAREAQDKEKAEQKAAAEEAPPAQEVPLASNAQLVQSVHAALRKDAQTAGLGVEVKLDEAKLIGLHGTVPSIESRSAAIAVATKVAGATRIKSYLVVRKQER